MGELNFEETGSRHHGTVVSKAKTDDGDYTIKIFIWRKRGRKYRAYFNNKAFGAYSSSQCFAESQIAHWHFVNLQHSKS
jgi:hypothetical protein